jgi:hypothetical protein
MLSDFGARFHLDLSKDFEQIFRCWNTGHPDGITYDPDYVGKGLARMVFWPLPMAPGAMLPNEV